MSFLRKQESSTLNTHDHKESINLGFNQHHIFKPEASSSKASWLRMRILFFLTSMIPLAFIFAKVLERVSLIVPSFEAI